MKTIFLGRQKPAIDAAIEKLYDEYLSKDKKSWNLSRKLLVVPSVRVKKEFLNRLLLFANHVNVILELPKIVTIGRVPEFIYQQTKPLADEVTQALAWFNAVKKSDKNKREKYLPALPKDDDLNGQIVLGKMFFDLHKTLAAELPIEKSDADKRKKDKNLPNPILDFGDIVMKLQELQKEGNSDSELERWSFFTQIEKEYLNILDNLGYWDIQTARRYALLNKSNENFKVPFDQIILFGIVDLNNIQKAMLDAVEEDKLVALIYAPQEESDGFDSYGSLKAEYWAKELKCPLAPAYDESQNDKKIVQVESPADQAYCAFDFISKLKDNANDNTIKYSADQITIGIPDQTMMPFVQSVAQKLNVPLDDEIGVPFRFSLEYALLHAITNYIELKSFEAFSALVRHPVVYEKLLELTTGNSCDVLTALDYYQQQSYPVNFGLEQHKELQSCSNDDERFDVVFKALDWVIGSKQKQGWLSDLLNNTFDTNNFPNVLIKIFEEFPCYKQQLKENRFKDNALLILIKMAQRLKNVLSSLLGKPTPISFIKMLLKSVETYTIQDFEEEIDNDNNDDNNESEQNSHPSVVNAATGGVHLANWLELVWNPAPVLAILSFNEGIVPQSVNAHLFLPNHLRTKLGILDNNRRFARDAYALKAIFDSKEKLCVIFSKRNTEGKGVLPSRLLFHNNKEVLAKEALFYFDDDRQLPKFELNNNTNAIDNISQDNTSRDDFIRWAQENLSENSTNRVLKGYIQKHNNYLSPTTLRSYLACPFRYYLQKIVKVQPEDYSTYDQELPAASFGDLLHTVLKQWGLDTLRSQTRSVDKESRKAEINKQLCVIIDKVFDQTYSDNVTPGVRMQKEIVRMRLEKFAEFQAKKEIGSHWKILAVEKEFTCTIGELRNVLAERNIIKNNKPNSDIDNILLKGKIDRIDESDGKIVIIDYKTADTAKTPEKAHLKKDNDNTLSWIDLQMPLYRFLCEANSELSDLCKNGVQIGYINISKDEVEWSEAKWDDINYASAWDTASEVISNISNGIFWPPATDVQYDDYPEFIAWLAGEDNFGENK